MGAVGIFGKHVAFGDFLSAGLSEQTLGSLTVWLDRILPQIRDAIGPGWEAIYDGAPKLRFWLGADVVGKTLAGVMTASRDKVGRRYPLLLAEEGGFRLPPVLDPDQSFYDRMLAHLDTVTPEPEAGAKGLLKGLDGAPDTEDEGAAFWAVNPKIGATELLAQVSTTDHMRAAAGRSYWWVEGDGQHASAIHAGPGLPDAAAFVWLLRGVAADTGSGEGSDEQ